MTISSHLKKIVRDRYSQIASDTAACCGNKGFVELGPNQCMNDTYTQLNGYIPESDLHLGCGIPTQYAQIRPGQTVVDLGSGAGNDVFIARSLVGENGRVIGIDMTKKMIAKANDNLSKTNFENVEFKLGDIENIPLEDNTADVVISNCVLNLVPDKQKSFREIFRILKPGGHFCISDIVSTRELPPQLEKIAALYTGCISGATEMQAYIQIIEQSGFDSIQIRSDKKIKISPDMIEENLSEQDRNKYPGLHDAFRSITVYGIKPI